MEIYGTGRRIQLAPIISRLTGNRLKVFLVLLAIFAFSATFSFYFPPLRLCVSFSSCLHPGVTPFPRYKNALIARVRALISGARRRSDTIQTLSPPALVTWVKFVSLMPPMQNTGILTFVRRFFRSPKPIAAASGLVGVGKIVP